tara:strand:- start:38 stop:166 length:129 start_codon:yes stop_codon:yes gene_type:complete
MTKQEERKAYDNLGKMLSDAVNKVISQEEQKKRKINQRRKLK